jgi:hypothetical protein
MLQSAYVVGAAILVGLLAAACSHQEVVPSGGCDLAQGCGGGLFKTGMTCTSNAQCTGKGMVCDTTAQECVQLGSGGMGGAGGSSVGGAGGGHGLGGAGGQGGSGDAGTDGA